MQLQLILTDNCSSCAQTRKLWETVCDEFQLELIVLNLDSPDGKKLANTNALKTFPALLVEGRVRMVGLPGAQSARKLLETEITKQASKPAINP
ncbi:MAG TPA: hypothetical protein ENI64_01205 [Gammaproteobacteria bacterium]|nr:hypothetical protein [Gammaproteobacteria bacterium]